MIIERNIFRLKFGNAKQAIAIWKQIMEEGKKAGMKEKMRMLTDMTGPSYTLILEMKLLNVNEIGHKNYEWMTIPALQQLYQQFIPLCETSEREYFTIEMEREKK